MITRTGERVFTNNKVAPSQESIAVALSRIPRFCGHTEEWYSVFSHTMVVINLMKKQYRLDGQLHDAPESVVSDVPTPWKTAAAKKREYMLLRRIYRDLGVALPNDEAQMAVNAADAAALAAEAHVLGHPAADEIWPSPGKRALELTEYELSRTMFYLQNPDDALERWLLTLIENRSAVENSRVLTLNV